MTRGQTRTQTVSSTVHSTTSKTPPPPNLHICRQSVEADIVEVLDLETPFTRVIFGDVDLKNCIEKCVCKTLVNVERKVVGFVVVMDHPNVPALVYCSWINWIRRYYRINFASPWNTMFIHYLVWDSRYPKFFTPMMKSLYKNNVRLEQILLVVPPRTQIFPELEFMFTAVYPNVDGTGMCPMPHAQALYINLRHSVVSKLIVRKAGEEDNIDVQPMVYHQFDVLKFIYGDFKLGNVIDLKDANKSILVAEKANSVTVGVMSVSTCVDYQNINYFFHHMLDRVDHYGRSDTPRSDSRRAVPFPADTFPSVDDFSMLSVKLDLEKNQSMMDEEEEEEEVGEEEDREDASDLYWDVDGDMFRIVDPVMEYLFMNREKGVQRTQSLEENFRRRSSTMSTRSSVDYTYWGRPSWSASMLPQVRESYYSRDRTLTIKDQQPVSIYGGSDNAFIITLFALHPDLDTRYGFDILEASFECFPEKHFLLMTLPTAYQGSPLMQHMVRLSPKMSRDFPHELYVTHRNAIFSEFTVRPVSIVDLMGISELVENITYGRKIRNIITSLLLQENNETKAFVLECEDFIVGVAVVSDNFGLQQTQPHYKIEELIQYPQYGRDGHGLLRHLVLCPAFLKIGSFFLRQILHQLGLETLSYCLLPDEIITQFQIDVSPITLLEEMIPVRPRTRIHYEMSALDIYTPEDYAIRQEHDFALFITTEKYLSIPKLELNYRIVVVGASDTALSFLENLIFRSARKHVRYNNLTLVSIHGLPLELRPHVPGDKMIPHSGFYTREYMTRISLSTHVNVLYGALTVINRKEKMICLNEDHWMRYDFLFLFTGTQFCKPWPTIEPRRSRRTLGSIVSFSDKEDHSNPKDGCHKNDDIREMHSRVSREYGDNLFVVNTSADAVIALGQLKKIIKNKKQGKVLIYGNCINMYTCTEALMTFGVPGHKIVVITSTDSCRVRSLDNNPIVEKMVMQTMQQAGVTIHSGYSLIHWNLRHKYLHKVMFRNEANVPLTLDCLALFCYGAKSTNAKTYLAVNDAGLVFNNGIIINNQFRTNDEFIFAAGPGTRYSNRYQPSEVDHHAYYSSMEVGLQASQIFRKLVEPHARDQEPPAQTVPPDPSFQSKQESEEIPQQAPPEPSTDARSDTLPALREPTMLVARLPGGWNFVRVSAPGRPLPLECQLHGQGESGPVLITGVPILPDGSGYFQLSFSTHHTVREIVLLSKNEIPFENLRNLYGKHERLLNNLFEHYNQGLISDFYSFFSQPWTYALYTARFGQLLKQCVDIFVSDENVGLPQLQDLNDEQLHQLLRNVDHDTITHRYLSSSVPMYVEHLTLKFVSERSVQLPMYFTDAVLASMYRTYSTSPLHKDSGRNRQKQRLESIEHSS